MASIPSSIRTRLESILLTSKVIPDVTLLIVENIVVAIAESSQAELVAQALCVPRERLSLQPLNLPRSVEEEGRVSTLDREAITHALQCFVGISDQDALTSLHKALPVYVRCSVEMIHVTDASVCDHHIVVADGSDVVGSPLVVKQQSNRITIDCPAGNDAFRQALESSYRSRRKLDITIGSARKAQGAPVPQGTKTTKCRMTFLSDSVRGAVSEAVQQAQQAMELTSSGDLGVCWPPEVMLPIQLACAVDTHRRALHRALLLPNVPRLTVSNNIASTLAQGGPTDSWFNGKPKTVVVPRRGLTWENSIVTSPHLQVNKSNTIAGSVTSIVQGPYDYYHYRIDGFQDDGWGCAYRSLQSVLSWFQHAGITTKDVVIPSVREIQQILKRVDFGKESQPGFVGSREWIGSYEVMLVLCDFVPAVECNLKRLDSGSQLATDAELHKTLIQHFQTGGPPVMIGGSSYAHTILGIDVNMETHEAQLLILDPHYSSNTTDMKIVKQKGWCGWKNPSKFFESSAFYNLCIPKVQYADFS